MGKGFSSEGFTADYIFEKTIFGNFGIYKSYYAVIKTVPDVLPYMYLYVIVIYTLVLAIPRIIWPGKPNNPINDPQLYGINEDAYYGGYAYPNLGEYYYAFGTIGIIIFMGISGYLLANIETKYRFKVIISLDYIIYSILVPATFQVVTRGYTPGNFYLFVALFIPCWCLKRFILKRIN